MRDNILCTPSCIEIIGNRWVEYILNEPGGDLQHSKIVFHQKVEVPSVLVVNEVWTRDKWNAVLVTIALRSLVTETVFGFSKTVCSHILLQ